tara:strand:- start:163 stop:291 length:129 start_codon:yes stop_codon:yes gene_type:complete
MTRHHIKLRRNIRLEEPPRRRQSDIGGIKQSPAYKQLSQAVL